MNRADFLTRMPKVDLHTHLTGTIGPRTLAELAKRAGVTLPSDILKIDSPEDFFEKLNIVSSVLTTPEDFELVAYEYMTRSAEQSNLRHCELAFNPTLYPASDYVAIVAAISRGARQAADEHGMSWVLIPAVLREQGVGVAEQLLDLVLANRTEETAGIGLDGDELVAPPELFVEVFRKAGQAGLKRTAHVTYPPATRVGYCIEELGCDRIDHGYYVLEDEDEARRVRDLGVPITVCHSMTCASRGWNPGNHPIATMLKMDFNLVLGTDDEAFVDTNIGREYVIVCDGYSMTTEAVEAITRRGIDAAWVGDDRKAELHREVDAAFASLDVTD
ncbi:adenine deaminase [Acrocarpospora pleiomorpha]|uniref:Adenine deaminase n=1 Tax=Acrocarpospora pleiomorpha TaxID=90975 RepID=A0A5M3Y6F0_9ACTN|nr:hypothetical protein [Acrocarpospora pleiomorpha]GES27068.1 adenine deaminase [Acrocarpospora pleiomorpha]